MTNSVFTQIQEYLKEKGEPDYRFRQILHEIFENKVTDFSQMTTLSKTLREDLIQKFPQILALKPIDIAKSTQVQKALFELFDKHRIETVSMMFKNEERTWQSLCVSSQVGCSLGCKFCTTGTIGLKRNLTIDEIIGQVLYFYLKTQPVNSIAFMGMGEPLLNPNLIPAIELLTADNYFNFGQRRISVSTVGVIPGLISLIRKFPQVNIAFSLHHPNQNEREKLMPVARKYKTADVIKVLDDHIKKNRRKVLIAYTLLKGINDDKKALSELIKLIKDRGRIAYLYHVNLISYHETSQNMKYQPSNQKTVEWFENELKKAHISVTKRQSFGDEIDAACGQLYAKYQKM
ncbi:radical SAM protein [Candidatus Dojkabacteria bacterium]|nr:radical SAM protein [Candidatus Dojkabacteria bacterium]